MAASADIVFLVDKTRSMQRVLGALAEGVGTALTTLANPPRQDVPVVTDWRAKVIGYGDVRHDGEKWWKEAPFRVADVAQVKADLAALLPAAGGGDDPESLLDALFKVATMGSTPEGTAPDPGKWREGWLRRVVVVFSDAPTHPQCDLPEASGAAYDQVYARLKEAGITLFLYVPRHESTYIFDAWPGVFLRPIGEYVGSTDDSTRALEYWASHMKEFHDLFRFMPSKS